MATVKGIKEHTTIWTHNTLQMTGQICKASSYKYIRTKISLNTFSNEALLRAMSSVSIEVALVPLMMKFKLTTRATKLCDCEDLRPAICVARAYRHSVTPAQLMRPGIGRNASCAWVTVEHSGLRPRELWFSIYSCTPEPW